jgi:hypothetical protein
MAKIPLKDFSSELKKQMQAAYDELVSTKNMKAIGEDLAEQIRIRTRLGNGLAKNGGEPTKLKPLSPGYINERKTMEELSPLTTPKRSNLTQTGEMLDELIATSPGPKKLTLTFKSEESKTKAEANAKMGRPFMAISRVQIERLTNSLKKQIKDILKKF